VSVGAKPITRYPWYLRPFFWNQKRKFNAALDLPAQGFCASTSASARSKLP
jgi:hypothetical protein